MASRSTFSSESQVDNIAFCLQIVQRMHSVLPKASSFLNALTKVLTKKIKDQRNLKPYPGKIYLPLPLLQASMEEESKENSTPMSKPSLSSTQNSSQVSQSSQGVLSPSQGKESKVAEEFSQESTSSLPLKESQESAANVTESQESTSSLPMKESQESAASPVAESQESAASAAMSPVAQSRRSSSTSPASSPASCPTASPMHDSPQESPVRKKTQKNKNNKKKVSANDETEMESFRPRRSRRRLD